MRFFTRNNGWKGLKLIALVGLLVIFTELVASYFDIVWVSRFWGFIFEDTSIPIIFFFIVMIFIAFGRKDEPKKTQA